MPDLCLALPVQSKMWQNWKSQSPGGPRRATDDLFPSATLCAVCRVWFFLWFTTSGSSGVGKQQPSAQFTDAAQQRFSDLCAWQLELSVCQHKGSSQWCTWQLMRRGNVLRRKYSRTWVKGFPCLLDLIYMSNWKRAKRKHLERGGPFKSSLEGD